jgi:enterochelin esterase family protein
MGDFNNWGWDEDREAPTEPLQLTESAPGVWTYTMPLARDAYIEYLWSADEDTEIRLPDPFNRRRVDNGLGKYNQYFTMPLHLTTKLTKVRDDIPRGTISHHILTHPYLLATGRRDVWLYQPPTHKPVPLLVVFDGSDYVRRGRITEIVDNLIAQGRVRPLALALVANGRQARFAEYVCNDGTLAFVVQEVVPLARAKLNLLDIRKQPGAYGVLGSSMGGLMALYCALRMPHIFGRVLSQSGAFELPAIKHAPLIDLLVERYRGLPLHVWMDCGRFEWLLACNRRMYPLLREKGHQVTYYEYNGGHNMTSWRNDLPYGLETIFGEL